MKRNFAKFSVEDLIEGTEGILKKRGALNRFKQIGTDTRIRMDGQIFWPLHGPKFNGHDFMEKSIQHGAKAIVTHQSFWTNEDITVIQVDDTLSALHRFCQYWRRKMKAKVLALTGSVGKTSTKNFLGQILKSCVGDTVAIASGSFNNHWGVPLSLLDIHPLDQFAVIEIGMNAPGEIRKLTELVEPDGVLVTRVAPSHLEGLGSLKAIASEKASLYDAAINANFACVNLDCPWMSRYNFERFPKVIRFSEKSDADVNLNVEEMTESSLTLSGKIGGVFNRTKVPVFGKQNLANLMAASALALGAGIESEKIWVGLGNCQPSWGRSQWVKSSSGISILFDAYNASPVSFSAAFENLRILKPKGRLWAIIGEMKELGTASGAYHKQLGEDISALNVHWVGFVGKYAENFQKGFKGKNLELFQTYNEVLDALKDKQRFDLCENDWFFIKGSRGLNLDKIIPHIS